MARAQDALERTTYNLRPAAYSLGFSVLLFLTQKLTALEGAFRVFSYLTLRAILAALTALVISFADRAVDDPRACRDNQIGQRVRDDGPKSHLPKAGTPTMGGALILVAIVASARCCGPTSPTASCGSRCCVTLAFGLIGFWDDYLKLVVGNSRGLIARYKYFWQSVAGLGCALALFVTAKAPAETALYVPFFKTVVMPLGFGYIAAHVLRRRRLQQCGEPDGRARRARDHARGAGRRRAGGIRVCNGQCGLLRLSRHSFHRGHR